MVWGSMGLFVAFVVFVAFAIMNFTPTDPANYKHTQPVEYYLYVPKGYSGDKEWPLFVGIHGAGSSGMECWNLWQSSADKEGFILLCPTIPGDATGYYQDVGENTVWNAINAVKKEYRVKPRMFFSGFSAGAFFIQGFAFHYPEYVNGLSILSSGVYLNPRVFRLLIPMSVVIGDQDDSVAVQTSKLFVNDLQVIGFDVHYEVLPNVGHTVTQKGVDLTIDLFRKASK
jgi:predicted peptidase